MKKILGLFLVLFSFGLLSHAQGDSSPVKWRFSVKMVSPTEGKITITSIIDKPWHIYGTQKVPNGPVPTSFDFTGSKGIKFINEIKPSQPAEAKLDPSFNQKLYMWSGKISFVRNFKLTGDVKDAVIKGSVKFMCCDDTNCMPPKTQSFNIKIKPFNPAK